MAPLHGKVHGFSQKLKGFKIIFSDLYILIMMTCFEICLLKVFCLF